MATSYDWHPAPPGRSVFKVETRNLGWWVLLAICISLVVHVFLYLVLGAVQRRGLASGAESEVVWRQTREQASIDRETLEKLLSEPAVPERTEIVPERLSDLDLVDTTLDEFDLMEQMREETIRMAPMETPQIFSDAAPRAPGEALSVAAGELEIAVSEMLSRDLDAMRRQLVDSSAQVSEAQPVLELNPAEDLVSTVDTDEFFKEAASRAFGTGADDFMKGYASLDELIGRTGGIPVGEEKIALPTDILFEYNEYELKEEARLSMMKLAFVVQTNPDALFVIEGHTDSFGGDDYNLELSRKRAQAVKDWLVERLRIDTGNIQVVGVGKARPIVPVTGTADEQALNRRVEIVVRRE